MDDGRVKKLPRDELESFVDVCRYVLRGYVDRFGGGGLQGRGGTRSSVLRESKKISDASSDSVTNESSEPESIRVDYESDEASSSSDCVAQRQDQGRRPSRDDERMKMFRDECKLLESRIGASRRGVAKVATFDDGIYREGKLYAKERSAFTRSDSEAASLLQKHWRSRQARKSFYEMLENIMDKEVDLSDLGL